LKAAVIENRLRSVLQESKLTAFMILSTESDLTRELSLTKYVEIAEL
jgi:hypothetical protein